MMENPIIAPKKRRAPGGGRKPQGEFHGKSTTMTTRITPMLRKALDEACEASGRSLSQEVEYRLAQSVMTQFMRKEGLIS